MEGTIVMIEYANNTAKRRKARSIEDVPAFRDHLDRHRLRNLAEWEARQKQEAADDGAALALQARYAQAKGRR
jgi:hypothetical protein